MATLLNVGAFLALTAIVVVMILLVRKDKPR